MSKILEGSFGGYESKEPFALWQDDRLDEDFKDLISSLTHFDPDDRMTAERAWRHRWFRDV